MKSDNNNNSWVTILFSDRKALSKLILLIIFLTILLVVIAEYAAWRISTSSVELSYSPNGAAIIIGPDKKLKATFPLSSSARWTNSGIEVPPNSKVKITAIGRATLAIHHLVQGAREDVKPEHTWIGPDGKDFSSMAQTSNRSYSNGMLLSNASPIGSLLAVLHKQGTPPPDVIHNPRPEGLSHIGSAAIIENRDTSPRTLWFIVNEMLLDPINLQKSYNFYVSPEQSTEKEKKQKESRFNYIKNENYWDLWWDDNVGTFVINVEEI